MTFESLPYESPTARDRELVEPAVPLSNLILRSLFINKGNFSLFNHRGQ